RRQIDCRELRERTQKTLPWDCAAGEQSTREDTEKRVVHGLVKLRAEAQQLGVELVRLLARAEQQLAPLRASVAHFEHHVLGDLELKVEREVLHISERMVRGESVHGIAGLGQQPSARSHGLRNSLRIRIAQ